MTRILSLAFGPAFLLLPCFASAETASVRGGEHQDFTRIVLEAQSLGNWQLGREGQSYIFRAGGAVTAFDLARAFNKIPRARLSTLAAGPDPQSLRLTLACDCHAIAFEVRPGLVAIDFRNGPAEAGSEFEAALPPLTPTEASPSDKLPAYTPPGDAFLFAERAENLPSGQYDWLESVGVRHPSSSAEMDEEATDEAFLLLDPLRDALLRQISRGVAEGVIEPGNPADLPDPSAEGLADSPGLRISNGELPGLRSATGRTPAPNLTATGRPCLPDHLTDITAWRPEVPASVALTESRAALLSEFDAPQVDNILKSARIHISFGFGAEARQLLSLLPTEEVKRNAALADITHLVDLEPPQAGAFAGMESCDTPAALWATLAIAIDDENGDTAAVNSTAVARSFSTLSPEMRAHFGPTLVDYYLSLGDETSARRIRDASLRPPLPASQSLMLMDAELQLRFGSANDAGEIAKQVFREPGRDAAEAAILIAEAAFAGNRLVSPELAPQLSSFAAELRSGEIYPRLRRAEILTLAMAGDFQSAFHLLEDFPAAAPDLWEIAGTSMPDDLLLIEGLRRPIGDVRPDTRRKVARRLLDHGFATVALEWLGPENRLSTAADKLLAAEAELAVWDARSAIRLLAGENGPEAEVLRARAALQLGNAGVAAAILAEGGDTKAALRAEFWAGDWTALAQRDLAGLSPAAAMLTVTKNQPGAGPLAEGARLVSDSEAARKTIADLVRSLPNQFP